MALDNKANWFVVYRWLMAKGHEYCRQCLTRENLTFDHIVPQAHGGTDGIKNITILCSFCNNKKGANFYSWLEPIEWPSPLLIMKNADDIEPGDILTRGIVVSKHFVSHQKYSAYDVLLNTRDALIPSRKNHTLMEISSAQNYITLPQSLFVDRAVA